MIDYSIDPKSLILRLEPKEKISSHDFEQLSRKVDRIIEKHKYLNGVLIVIPSFPGWKDLDGVSAHLDFIKTHHKHVKKVAVVTTDMLIKLAANQIAKYHFLNPVLRVFDTESNAMSWL